MHIVCRRVEVMAAQPFEARGVDGGRFPTQLGPKKLTLQLSKLAKRPQIASAHRCQQKTLTFAKTKGRKRQIVNN